MNYSVIRYILGWVLFFEGLFMLLPAAVGALYHEKEGVSFFIMAIFCILIGKWITLCKPPNSKMFTKEGFVIVALSWIVMSFFGAIPLVLNGDIPHIIDALFEIVSGFTTTGASILTDVEALSYASLFWRSFTHWIGGMGVFVFMLAILPAVGGYNMHLLRAESPGPSVGKLVPRLRDTASILYRIYIVMTIVLIVALLLGGAPLFDSITIAIGTAGTGGFAIKADSLASYSPLIQGMVTVGMILFGVNFNFYFFLIGRHKKEAFKMEEVKWYFLIILASIVCIGFNVRGHFSNYLESFHHSAFQVASIITTSGFATENFDLWPSFSKAILVLLMFIGACAGSTGGGLKVSRLVILAKTFLNEISHYIHPNIIKSTRFDNKPLDKSIIKGVSAFFAIYIFIFTASVLLVTLDGKDLITSFTAVAATFNNIGPGLGLVGPSGHFNVFSYPVKLILIFDMLAGRLEIFPMMILCIPSIWKMKR